MRDHTDTGKLEYDFASRMPMSRMAQIGAMAMVLLVVLFIVFWNPTPPQPLAPEGGQAATDAGNQPTVVSTLTTAGTSSTAPPSLGTHQGEPATAGTPGAPLAGDTTTGAGQVSPPPVEPGDGSGTEPAAAGAGDRGATTPPGRGSEPPAMAGTQPPRRTTNPVDSRPRGPVKIHEVTDEDTLVRIAIKYYGTAKAYPHLARVNKLRDPNRLPIGKRLVIPSREDLMRRGLQVGGSQRPPARRSERPPAADGTRYHVVRPGDSYIRLARRYYNDARAWRRIMEANNLPENGLPVGREIVIPPLNGTPTPPVAPAGAPR